MGYVRIVICCIFLIFFLAKRNNGQDTNRNAISLSIPNLFVLADNNHRNNYIWLDLIYRHSINNFINYRVGIGNNFGPINEPINTYSTGNVLEFRTGLEFRVATLRKFSFYTLLSGRYEHFELDSIFIYPNKYYNYLGIEPGFEIKFRISKRIDLLSEFAVSYGTGLEKIMNEQHLFGISNGWYLKLSKIFEFQLSINL